ncbi:MAG TPA: hypothetical protein VG365_12155 [Solirubrobacteraceae bacterium]|jgi:hypothetical protein|nr:hypothetical protein [Solirubrobacteraceae bacterium]
MLNAVKAPVFEGVARMTWSAPVVTPRFGVPPAAAKPNVQAGLLAPPAILGVAAEACATEPTPVLAATTARISNPTSPEVSL